MQFQSTVCQRFAQFCFQHQSPLSESVHLLKKETERTALGPFSLVHGNVSAMQQTLHVLTIPWEQANADAGGNNDRSARNRRRSLQDHHQSLKKDRDLCRIHPRQYQHELITG
ncbi:hypothetical protein D3C85_998810 [compost metagenome]